MINVSQQIKNPSLFVQEPLTQLIWCQSKRNLKEQLPLIEEIEAEFSDDFEGLTDTELFQYRDKL